VQQNARPITTPAGRVEHLVPGLSASDDRSTRIAGVAGDVIGFRPTGKIKVSSVTSLTLARIASD
jgi:hypothetical protein